MPHLRNQCNNRFWQERFPSQCVLLLAQLQRQKALLREYPTVGSMSLLLMLNVQSKGRLLDSKLWKGELKKKGNFEDFFFVLNAMQCTFTCNSVKVCAISCTEVWFCPYLATNVRSYTWICLWAWNPATLSGKLCAYDSVHTYLSINMFAEADLTS